MPGRLLDECEALKAYLTGHRPIDDVPAPDDALAKHYDWVRSIAAQVGTDLSDDEADAALRRGLGVKCARVLADAGVYKQTPEGDAGVLRFLGHIGYRPRT